MRTSGMLWIYLVIIGVIGVLGAPQGYYYGYRYEPNQYRNPYTNAAVNQDAENPKFLGAANQESERTLIKKFKLKKKLHKLGHFANPCFSREARDAGDAEQGRVLWDLNVYNVYHNQNPCGGFGGIGAVGGAVAGGALSDPVYQRPQGLFTNFLNLLVPGGALNPTGGVRPQVSNNFATNNVANDPVNFEEVAASTAQVNPAALTPGQLVGGVAHTVNNVIQTLSGNVRPVGRYLMDFFF